MPEKEWRPIQKTFDRVPPDGIINDKVFLREWEQVQQMEYYQKVFDRKDIDLDVFKKFYANGEIIKMTVDARELTKEKEFWLSEAQIQEDARLWIERLKRVQPFDIHKLHP